MFTVPLHTVRKLLNPECTLLTSLGSILSMFTVPLYTVRKLLNPECTLLTSLGSILSMFIVHSTAPYRQEAAKS